MYEATSCWALADGEINSLQLNPNTSFYKGELGVLLDSPLLEQQLASALEAAYVHEDKEMSSMLGKPLILEQKKEEQ